MVLPLIPIALAGSTLAGGFLAGSALSKKTPSDSVFSSSAPFSATTQTYAPVEHKPYEQYSKAIQYAPVTSVQYPDYAININSPDAVAQTKKTQTVTSQPTLDYSARQSSESGKNEGTDMVMLALIAGAAVVAYGVVSK